MITKEDLELFVKGDRSAFDKIYAAYAPGMFGISLRYCKSKDDAEDVLQETFIKVYQNAGSFDVTRPIGAWIKTITIHSAINFIRENKKYVLTDEQINPHEVEMPVEEEADNMKDKLLKVLGLLPDGYRTVFNLFVLDNLTHKEIAGYLGITEGTSKSQLAKAKKMIQQLLQNQLHHAS